MLSSTVLKLRCPRSKCSSQKGELRVHAVKSIPIQTLDKQKLTDVWHGHVECPSCQSKYPILSGILILVEHVRDYLCVHVKGISKLVADAEIPKEYRNEYLKVKKEWLAEQGSEYIEEDLESERVTSLYLMNHYLRASESRDWFQAKNGSPLIENLISEFWDQGPFTHIEKWIRELRAQNLSELSVVELGCGVGGFSRMLKDSGFYLGVDSSFASIALARHLNLGVPYPHEIKIPGDLIDGAVSRTVEFKPIVNPNCDFILADLEELPLKTESFDGSVALNAIDMLDEPSKLPRLQFEAVKKDGFAIQSCPYIWHSKTAKRLRAKAPKVATDSAMVVEWLYEKAGFKIQKREVQIPWLFFKHFRQLEIYSVHAFLGFKN
jgi:SAM-dependent methyltransferase